MSSSPSATIGSTASSNASEKRELAEAIVEQDLRRSLHDFRYLVAVVFAASFRDFVGGVYLDEVCDHVGANDWTMDLGPRDHFKSTRLYALIIRDIIRLKFGYFDGLEGQYFSYSKEMAGYHLTNVKELVRRNPYLLGLRDNKRSADSVIDYQWGDGVNLPRLTFNPQGLLSFKRGIHADRVYVDDPLRDPENKLSPLSILKINKVITTELDAFVNRNGEFRFVGTAQTWHDIWFADEYADFRKRFAFWRKPAIIDDAKKQVLWPEWMDYDRLDSKRRAIGKAFDGEYQTRPTYDVDSYLERTELFKCLDETLQNQNPYVPYPELSRSHVVAAWDLGKKAHPAHLSILVVIRGRDRLYYQQKLSWWMDGWDYQDQLNFIDGCIANFSIDTVAYDNTRGELEGFAEQGKLSRVYTPVVLNPKRRNSIAAGLGALVNQPVPDGEEKRIKFVSDDERQFNQMLSVTNGLQAMDSPEGHGDSFWTNGMAIEAAGGMPGTFDDEPERPRRGPGPETAGLLTKQF